MSSTTDRVGVPIDGHHSRHGAPQPRKVEQGFQRLNEAADLGPELHREARRPMLDMVGGPLLQAIQTERKRPAERLLTVE